MMVKVEEQQDPALPRPAGAEPMSPFDDYYYGADEEEYYEETDSEGEGEGDGAPQLKKGPWTPEEDRRLRDYVQANGEGNWNQVRINAGLNRCGKSCRLRWSNHLRPDLKKGPFDDEEVDKILRMHYNWGNKWAKMAAVLPGRTDNEIKNFWNTRLKRHQRAHLPIYPEYLISESSNQDMDFGTPEASFGTKQNELSQNILESDDLINDYFDHKIFYKRLPVPSVDIPCPSLVGPNSLQMDAMDPLMKLLNPSAYTASEYNGTLSYVQIPDESEKLACSTSFYGMTDNHLATPGNAIVREHDYPMFNGNSSTSWTTQMPMKTELPSVQYYPYNFSDNNAWVGDCPSCSIEQADNLNESPGSISSQNTSLDAILHSDGGLVDPIVQSQGVFDDGMFPTFTYNQVQPTNVYAIFSSVPGDDEEFDSFHLGEVQAPKSPSTLSPTEVGTHDASPEASLLNDMFLKDPSISIYNSLMEDYEEAKPSTAGTGLDSFGNGMPGASNVSYLSDL